MRSFTVKTLRIFIFVLCLSVSVRAADVQITSSSANAASRSIRTMVFTSATVGYYINNEIGLTQYKKTTDGGVTWGSGVDVFSPGTIAALASDVWFDQWTPGDAGTLIHIWSVCITGCNGILYKTLDTSSDTLGTQRTVFSGASSVAGRGVFVSGTKTRSGYLYTAFDIDAGAEKGFYRSTDAGVTWNSLSATFVEATIDECTLFPATGTGDNNDCWAIYQDASADALTMKMWDSSAAAEVESSTIQTMIENATDVFGMPGFAGSIRKSDGHIIVVSFSELDTVTEDFQAWDVGAVNAGSLTGITALTNITTNIDDMYYPSVFMNPVTDKIYVVYNGKSDGSESVGTASIIYYKTSTDGGTTWSSGDTAYMQGSADDSRQTWTSVTGPLFIASWRNSDVTNIGQYTNGVNSVVTSTASGFLRLIGR